jgi:rubrerythrin
MLTGKEDLMQALIESFLMEKGTREFYSEASGKAVTQEAKELFQTLSRWEGKHMDFIQSLYETIQDNREIESFENFKGNTHTPDTEAGIPVKDLEARIERHDITDERQALALALQIEGKAYNLYRKFAESAEDTSARVVFKEMMEQEVKHTQELKKLREKMEKTG